MKKIILINLISLFFLSFANANDPKSIGNLKIGKLFTYNDGKGKICLLKLYLWKGHQKILLGNPQDYS